MSLGSPQTLITRCPECATAFRASAEQLSRRNGLVRCGRCSHVFDARAHAVDVESAVSPATAGPETPATTPDRKADDEPLYDATSFIAAADEQLPSVAAESGEPADPMPIADPTETSIEESSDAADRDAGIETIESAQEPEEESPPAAEEAERPSANAESTEDTAEPFADTGPVGSDNVAIDEDRDGRSEADIDADPGNHGSDPTAVEESVRPFAAVLEEARAERLDDHEHHDNASTQSGADSDTDSNPEGQAEAAADSASRSMQDGSAAASADAETAGIVERHDDDGDDIGDDRDAVGGPVAADSSTTDSPADEPPAALPDDRLDPIDAVVAALPPAAEAPPPGMATVAPLELEFGAPRRAQPGVSGWLGIPAMLLLLATLAAQIAYHLRGDLVLLFPSVRAAAVQLCDWVGCDLPSPQRAELMSIEASDLQADSINPAVMVLSATLRNRAPFAQAQPALELTLTDAQDQPVARRVIDASDYVIAGIQNGVFPASSELPVKIYFEASAVKATGYRLYLFYP